MATTKRTVREPRNDEAVEEKSTSDVKQRGPVPVISFTWPMYEAQTSNSSRRRVSDASTDCFADCFAYGSSEETY